MYLEQILSVTRVSEAADGLRVSSFEFQKQLTVSLSTEAKPVPHVTTEAKPSSSSCVSLV